MGKDFLNKLKTFIYQFLVSYIENLNLNFLNFIQYFSRFSSSSSNSERKFNSGLLNKYPSEDKIVKSFLEKQENQPFIIANSNGNINYNEFLKNSNNDYAKLVEGK